MELHIFSDYVCPFCYLGAGLVERLKGEPDIDLQVTWLPYELHADTPPEGIALADYFGADAGQMERGFQPIVARAHEMDLPINPPPVLFNSRRALALAEYARDEDRFESVHPLLFEAYFVENRNLFDLDVLREVAGRAGLDTEAAMAIVEAEAYEPRLREAMEMTEQYGITGVPTFILDDHYKIVGAQPYDVLRDAIHQAMAETVA